MFRFSENIFKFVEKYGLDVYSGNHILNSASDKLKDFVWSCYQPELVRHTAELGQFMSSLICRPAHQLPNFQLNFCFYDLVSRSSVSSHGLYLTDWLIAEANLNLA